MKLPRLYLILVLQLVQYIMDWPLTGYTRGCAGVLMPKPVGVSIDSCAPVLLIIIKLCRSSNCTSFECQINVALHIQFNAKFGFSDWVAEHHMVPSNG